MEKIDNNKPYPDPPTCSKIIMCQANAGTRTRPPIPLLVFHRSGWKLQILAGLGFKGGI
ncbi:MAG TPA: hypothetical protein PL078_03055 [Bacillota bacterium]|nr:hypothetical protein [Peptococcaceae bacterium MAG4]NLW37245.1 hypothetical protein [Peptococcaceae bacterium]HPZ42961.1 hypothetical protein [Bacillota bacterium]